MTNGDITLFGKLNLNNTFNVGLYISGIVFITSFIVAPVGIPIEKVRSTALFIIIVSVIARIIINILDDIVEANSHNMSESDAVGFLVLRYFLIFVYVGIIIINLS